MGQAWDWGEGHVCLDGAVGFESSSDPRTGCAGTAQSQDTRSAGLQQCGAEEGPAGPS